MLPSHPTVRINRREDKTLNLNLKVKPDGHLAPERQLLQGERPSSLAVNSAGSPAALLRLVGPLRHEGRFPQIRAKPGRDHNNLGAAGKTSGKVPSSWQHRRTIWRSSRSSESAAAALTPSIA